MRGSDFAELRTFAEVSTQRSFSRAAVRLGLSASAVSETIRSLEERLGVRLLHRTTRRVSLTGAGARLLERFGPAMVEIDQAVQEARDQRETPRGLVRIHVPRSAYQSHIEPALGRLARELPEVVIDLSVDDAIAAGPVPDGFDVVVRRREAVENGYVETSVGPQLRHVVLASPAYLAAYGTPKRPEELLEHRCINWRRPKTHEPERWCFEIDGSCVDLSVSGPLTASHCDVAIAAAAAGVGIAYVLEPLAANRITDGSVLPLLEAYLPRFDGWRICYPKWKQTPAAVLAVVENLTSTSILKQN